MNTEKKEGKIQENTLDTIQDNPVMERQSSDSSMKLTTDMDFKSQIISHSKNGSFSLLKQKNIPKENVTSSMRSLLNLNILNWSRNRLAGKKWIFIYMFT
jgi:predicted nuclease of predicted toxin-antitoxin system